MEQSDTPSEDELSVSALTDSIPDDVAKVELLADIIESAPIPIFLKNPKGIYLYINAAYTQAGGIPREKIIGKKDSDIYPESTAAAFRGEDLLAMKGPAPVQSTWPLQVGGEERIFRIVKFPIRGRQGNVAGVCGVALDVTDTILGEKAREDEDRRISAAKPFERLLASLTPQEARIAELLLQGLSDKQIAENLYLTVDTVRHHVSHVLKKLRRRSRTQVVIEMLRYRRRG